jgi:ABC-2 type transport system permease protein
VDLLLGKTLPYLVLASTSAAGALLLARVLFDMPMLGSVLDVAVMTLLFLAGGLGWGVLLSSIADTQQVAFQLSLLSTMLPTLLLSGFVFPISSMPQALQVITHIVPARYYIAALRAIVLKGAGPEVWWPQAAALLVYGAVVLSIATVRTIRSL